jgi:hypothetical protein
VDSKKIWDLSPVLKKLANSTGVLGDKRQLYLNSPKKTEEYQISKNAN